MDKLGFSYKSYTRGLERLHWLSSTPFLTLKTRTQTLKDLDVCSLIMFVQIGLESDLQLNLAGKMFSSHSATQPIASYHCISLQVSKVSYIAWIIHEMIKILD